MAGPKRLDDESLNAATIGRSVAARLARQQQDLCEGFNARYAPGTLVLAWAGGMMDGRGKVARVLAPAFVLGGHTAVVHLEGISGGVALSQIAGAVPSD